MLVSYKGGNAAMTISVGGGSYRLLPDTPVLLTGEQVKELQARDFTKKLVKLKQLEFTGLDSLDKDELAKLASQHGHELTGKEKVKDLIDLLSDGDDENDDTGDDTGTDLSKEPTEK